MDNNNVLLLIRHISLEVKVNALFDVKIKTFCLLLGMYVFMYVQAYVVNYFNGYVD